MSYKIKCVFGNWPLCDVTRFCSMTELPQRPQIFKRRQQTKSSSHTEEKIRIYANSKYIDTNVRWVLFTSTEYIWSRSKTPILTYLQIKDKQVINSQLKLVIGLIFHTRIVCLFVYLLACLFYAESNSFWSYLGGPSTFPTGFPWYLTNNYRFHRKWLTTNPSWYFNQWWETNDN